MKRLIPLLFLATTASASYSGYTYRRTITISSTNVSNVLGTVQNFPVLISTNDVTLSTGAGGHLANASGFDVVFSTKDDCSFLLHWDTETVNNTGTTTMNVWVSVPVLSTASATAATLYLCYGNSSITSYQGASALTWDSNFGAVYHLKDNPTGAAPQEKDSTVTGAHMYVVGADDPPTYGTAVTTTAQINGGVYFPTIAGGQYHGTLSSSTVNVGVTGKTFTLEGWINFNSIIVHDGGYGEILCQFTDNGTGGGPVIRYLDAGGFSACMFNNAGSALVCTSASSGVSNGTWHHVADVGDGANLNLYLDGVFVSSAVTTDSASTAVARMGNYCPYAGVFSDAKYDEFRISLSARNRDWLLTEYKSQNSPSTFATLGAETFTTAQSPVFSIQGGKLSVRGGYLAIGPSQTPVTVASKAGQCIGILCGVTYAN